MTRLMGVDVGGTFTDVVILDEGAIEGRKVPTSPHQADGVAAAVSGAREDVFLHGTTAATNALLEERGARVALVTDAGYEDIIEIARQDRPSLYDGFADRPRPLVERDQRFGLGPDEEALIAAVAAADPDVVAISLLESYADPGREIELERRLEAAVGRPVLRSTLVSPEFREYERTATTVLSGYLTPSVAAYLRALDERLPMERRLVMTSSGGLLPFSRAPEAAGRLVLSGPSGGALAAAALGRHHGYETVISFDMGGTSTDVSRITGGAPAVGAGHHVGGRVNRVPAIPIRTIGAGGGSIGWLDPGGALRVGPRSAGAVPGPASYGHGGTEATVTDANLVAGNLPADVALGGTVRLHSERAHEALARLARAMERDVQAAAAGMLEVVDSHMEHALRSVSVEEGADPREAVLVAFGGAGGLHATRLARRLGIRKVLVPPLSGVFSALGLLLATPRTDRARTVMAAEGEADLGRLRAELEGEVAAGYRATFGREAAAIETSADVRYRGQSHELEVAADAGWDRLRSEFEAAHRRRFGFHRPGEPLELVNLRAVATGVAPMTWSDLPSVSTDGRPRGRDGVWERETLPAGHALSGPAIVIERNSAVLLQAGDELRVLDDGTLEIDL
ncbi:MAG: hydantoinase/oxoprolinase family protein [Candidatus Limnocylindrales bacterium]